MNLFCPYVLACTLRLRPVHPLFPDNPQYFRQRPYCKRFQDAVDPEQSHGEGDGIANICHNVLIQAVEAVPVSVSVKVVWDSGYSTDTSKSKIEAAIQEYLSTIRKSWESSKMNNQYIRISQVEARILSVEGVIDVIETKLNDKEENVTLAYTQIPTFGGVAIV